MAKRKRPKRLTKDQRRRIEEARKEWDEKLRPLTDAMRDASRISEKDLRRVGRKQPRNLYFGDDYRGVMFDESDARAIVEAMNAELAAEALSWLDGTHPMIVAGGFHSAVERVHKAETCLASAVGSRANPGGAWASDLLGNPEKGEASELRVQSLGGVLHGWRGTHYTPLTEAEIAEHALREAGKNTRGMRAAAARGEDTGSVMQFRMGEASEAGKCEKCDGSGEVLDGCPSGDCWTKCPACHGSGARPSHETPAYNGLFPEDIKRACTVCGAQPGEPCKTGHMGAIHYARIKESSEAKPDASEGDVEAAERIFNEYARKWERFANLQEEYRTILTKFYRHVRAEGAAKVRELQSERITIARRLALLSGTDEVQHSIAELLDMADLEVNCEYERAEQALKDTLKVEGELAEAKGKIEAWEPVVRAAQHMANGRPFTSGERIEALYALLDALPDPLRPAGEKA